MITQLPDLAALVPGALRAGGAAEVLSAVIAGLLALSLALAAVTLALRARNALATSRWVRLEREWTAPLLEVLAGDRQAAHLLGRVAPRDGARFADFLVRFARRLRGPERDVLGRLAAPYLDTVAARVEAGRPGDRARRVSMLGMLRPDRYGYPIAAALDDPSPLVAMTAMRALAHPGHPGQLAAVLRRLERFDAWSPAFLASMLAGAGPEAAPGLRALLADRSRPIHARIVAAEALRLLKDLAAAAPAAAIVAEEAGAGDGTRGGRDLVSSALRLLAAVGTGAQAPAVRAACASGSPVVRAQACAALGAVGTAGDAGVLGPALEDADPWVVLHAARSLKALGGPALLERTAAGHDAAGLLVRQVLAE